LLGLYGFDIYTVFTGQAPIRVALAYISRLSFEPWSLWRANQLGGPEHLGWTPDTYQAAAIVDATNVNTVVSGNVGSKKPPKMPEPSYRPKVKEPEAKKVESLADFNIQGLIAAMGG
jgi:hypothetical protein